LFRALDDARRAGAAVWIGAPAGAGKTTVVASYLAACKVPALWYQLDAGDADVAAFFYGFGASARRLGRARRPLPLLTPEYLPGLQTFARNFFRALFARLPSPALVVLDNHEALPPDSPLQALLAAALQDDRAGITVIVLSRVAPPPVFARWRASTRFVVLDWEALRLQPEETRGICRLRRGGREVSEADALALHRLTEGWVAGLVLQLEQDRAARASDGWRDLPWQRVTFEYFAAEVLAHSPQPVREFLFQTALLPHVEPAMARALTGNAGAGELLAELAHRNYFTTRLGDGAYQYHALFREFLLTRGQAHFGSGPWRELQRRASGMLVERGLDESAAALMQQSGDHAGLEALIHQRAAEYAGSGRLHQLEQWLRALPEPRVDRKSVG